MHVWIEMLKIFNHLLITQNAIWFADKDIPKNKEAEDDFNSVIYFNSYLAWHYIDFTMLTLF